MAPSGDPGWMDRIAESLSEHEERRESLQDTPPRYEILGEISRGGMGIVYRAWDPVLGREVALKVLSADNSAEAHERFQNEVRLAAGLHHSNIVPIYDSGVWHDRDYMAMQLIEGTTLDSADVGLRTTVKAIRDAARALHYAHEKIVHRDIKPSNLLLDRQGRVFVTDFGVARQIHGPANLTNPGCVVGTPAYMSPEQAEGLPADATSDVYSLGATLYELATGRPPYSGKDPVAIVEAVRAGEPPPPRRLRPDLSKNVEALILEAMERRPQDRYATAAEFADDIDRYLSGERPRRRDRGIIYQIRRQFARHPWRSTAAIVFCALLLMAGVLLGYFIRGYVSLNRARTESDRDLRRSYYRKAAPFFTEAEDALTRMNEEDLASSTIVATTKTEQAISEKQALEARLRKEQEAARHLEAVLQAITRRSIPDGRLALDALKTVSPEKHEELLPRLRELEFDAGIEELQRLAAAADSAAFSKRYAELERPLYLPQKDRNPRLARPAMQLALNLAAAKRFADAVGWFDTAERLGLREPALDLRRGLARIDLERWEEAQGDLDRILKAGTVPDAKFAQLPYRRGLLAMAGKRWPEAIKEFDAALRIDPRLAAAHHDRGIARFRIQVLGRETLDGDLKAALELDPGMKPSVEYRDVALAYARTEAERSWGLEKAEDRSSAWTRVLGWLTLLLERSSPNDPDLLLERAGMHRRLGDLARAIDDARASLGALDSPRGHSTLGVLLYLQATVNKDPRTMEEAAGHLKSPYWKGLCRRYRGELEPALALFSEAGAGSPHVLLQRARTRLDLVDKGQEWREAADDAARAVAAASMLTEEDYIGGLYELQKVSRTEAIRLLTRDARLVRGQAGFEGDDYALCIEETKAALALEPRFASAFLWRGYARCKARQHRDAQDDFKEAIRLTTHPGEKENAALWLDRCTKHAKE